MIEDSGAALTWLAFDISDRQTSNTDSNRHAGQISDQRAWNIQRRFYRPFLFCADLNNWGSHGDSVEDGRGGVRHRQLTAPSQDKQGK